MRTRLQRLRDAKFFTGWVNDFDEREVRVRLSSSETCEPGDFYLLEIFGTDLDAIFQAQVTMAFDNQAYLTVHGAVNYRSATENARLSVSGIVGNMILSDYEVDVKVVDISLQGVGLVVRRTVPQKTVVKLRLITSKGEINATGEVRYCRPDATANGTFRVGIRLNELGRLEKARWMRLFENEAA